MSTHKAGGKASQHVSPEGKRLGIKVSHGQDVKTGSILVRQRGTTFHSGEGTDYGRDHTIYSKKNGKVIMSQKMGKKVLSVS